MKTMRKVVSTLLLVCVLAAMLCVSASADSMIRFTTPNQGTVTIDENKDYTLTINPLGVFPGYTWYWKINGQYVDDTGSSVTDPLAWTGRPSITINKPAGSYTVTVEVVNPMDSSVVDSCTCIVIAQAAALKPEYIQFTQSSVSLDRYGDWGPNVATVYPSGCNQSVTWKSNDESVAWVDSATGLVHAVGSGSAVITAESSEDSSVWASYTVYVSIPVTSISISPSYLDLKVGDDYTLTFNVNHAPTEGTLAWRSSNNAVATVEGGVVHAVAEGTATITASAVDGSAVSNQCLVTVRAKTTPTVTVTPVNVDLVLGQSATLTATVTMPAGSTGYPTYIDHWYSSSNAVQLSANNNTCVIKGVAATGSTPIEVRAYAHDGGIYGYALVTVSQADSLQLDVSKYSIASGGTVSITPANAVSGETFSWTYTPMDASIISRAIYQGNSFVLTAGESDGSITVTCTSKMDPTRTASVTIGVNGVDPYGNAKILPKSATWTRADGDLTFQISPAAYYMYLDNQFLNNKSTSQIVYWNGALTLKASYLATLANGTHTLKVYTAYDDSTSNPTGLVYANIYIEGNNTTGSAGATYGDNAHVKGTPSNLYFNAANQISEVYISDKWIDPANYSLSTDGKTLTLNANFLNQLAYGNYTMRLLGPGGATQSATFRIVTANYAPSTGDENNIGLWVAIMILSGAGAVALLPRRKAGMQ